MSADDDSHQWLDTLDHVEKEIGRGDATKEHLAVLRMLINFLRSSHELLDEQRKSEDWQNRSSALRDSIVAGLKEELVLNEQRKSNDWQNRSSALRDSIVAGLKEHFQKVSSLPVASSEGCGEIKDAAPSMSEDIGDRLVNTQVAFEDADRSMPSSLKIPPQFVTSIKEINLSVDKMQKAIRNLADSRTTELQQNIEAISEAAKSLCIAAPIMSKLSTTLAGDIGKKIAYAMKQLPDNSEVVALKREVATLKAENKSKDERINELLEDFKIHKLRVDTTKALLQESKQRAEKAKEQREQWKAMAQQGQKGFAEIETYKTTAESSMSTCSEGLQKAVTSIEDKAGAEKESREGIVKSICDELNKRQEAILERITKETLERQEALAKKNHDDTVEMQQALLEAVTGKVLERQEALMKTFETKAAERQNTAMQKLDEKISSLRIKSHEAPMPSPSRKKWRASANSPQDGWDGTKTSANKARRIGEDKEEVGEEQEPSSDHHSGRLQAENERIESEVEQLRQELQRMRQQGPKSSQTTIGREESLNDEDVDPLDVNPSDFDSPGLTSPDSTPPDFSPPDDATLEALGFPKLVRDIIPCRGINVKLIMREEGVWSV